MIVYHATKAEFSEDVLSDRIEFRILEFFKKNLKRSTSPMEIESWKNSMMYMDVELKQWSEATLSEKDGVINSFVGKNVRELPHPSYQVWSYATLLENFNETIYTDKINLKPCAYLHNYMPDDVIKNEHYKDYITKAPVFLRGETTKLREFIKNYVQQGDRTRILYRIEQDRIRPSKMLADSITALLKGNPEFVMIDDQKIVYETAMALSRKANSGSKKVLIVKGGLEPANLLSRLIFWHL